MDKVIHSLKTPLDKYTSVQKKISDEIKKIGGLGDIHGCIIDIDFLNHIYVNPIDLKITPYFALDIIKKRVYTSIPVLLEQKCPELYVNYTNQLQDNSESLPSLSQITQLDKETSIMYLDTDIYRASREISKMQKINVNVLTLWNEASVINNHFIES